MKGNKKMTIRMLKEKIAYLPDEMRIFADDAKHLGDDCSEFCSLFISRREPRKAILQTTYDFDAQKRTTDLLKYFSENDYEEQDAWIELSEMGFRPEDFADPEYAKQQMENYGLI